MTLSLAKAVRRKPAPKASRPKAKGKSESRPDMLVGDVYVNGKRLPPGPTLFEFLAARRRKKPKQ